MFTHQQARSFLFRVAAAGLALLPVRAPAQEVDIPRQDDWTDYGLIFEAGTLGDWDFQLFGGKTATVVKKGGTTYLYYNGACCYRIADDTVTWRSIGVATSPDGINFTKYPGNPVVSWSPNDNGEEGPTSGVVALDSNGDIVLYYGANTAVGPTSVVADARLAISSDGLSFSDQGVALDYSDSGVWGSGDELFPFIAYQEGGDWLVYYQPNGSPESARVGVASGQIRDELDSTTAATSGGSYVPAWGAGGAAKIGSDTLALFLNCLRSRKCGSPAPRTEVRTALVSKPHQLSGPIETYQFPDMRQATVLLDKGTATWFMYYRNADSSGYGVKLAPVGSPDTSAPTTPSGVSATPVDHSQIEVSWSPASDPDTGIVQYRIFRDGRFLDTVKGWSFRDTNLAELTEYSYEVSAVNYHGTEGPQSLPAVATTPADGLPPSIESVSASGDSSEVVVTFDEPVERASSENLSSYVLYPGIDILDAVLAGDQRTVILSTTPQTDRRTYRLTISGVHDRAASPNSQSSLQISYTFSKAPGLVGCWRLDEGYGVVVQDTSNFGNHGSLVYPGQRPALRVIGRFGGGLEFDGVDDLVTIDGSSTLREVTRSSHTFSAWVRAKDVPPNSADNNTHYSILTRSSTGLYYSHTKRFRAVIRTSDGEFVLQSGTFDPGRWHHVTMVVESGSRKLRLYVDGSEVSGSPLDFSGNLSDLGKAPYFIGTSDALVERWDFRLKGTVDEVFLFDQALTAREVSDLAGDPATARRVGGVRQAPSS